MDNFINHLLLELNKVGVAESAYEAVVINYKEVCKKLVTNCILIYITANTCNAQCPTSP